MEPDTPHAGLSDESRERRQQAFIASLVYQLKQAGTFLNPARLRALINVAKQNIAADTGLELLSFVEQASTLAGGNITIFTELCEKTRAEAFEMMIAHAEALGANAVLGVRYDATELMQGVTEVLAYGTAVIVEPHS